MHFEIEAGDLAEGRRVAMVKWDEDLENERSILFGEMG